MCYEPIVFEPVNFAFDIIIFYVAALATVRGYDISSRRKRSDELSEPRR